MKCLMFCAKSWSSQCVAVFQERCKRLTNPPPTQRNSGTANDLVLDGPQAPDRGNETDDGSESSERRILQAGVQVAESERENFIEDCEDIDCDAALRSTLPP